MDDQTGTRRLVRNPEPPVVKRQRFEIDLRIGVSQDAIQQDRAKMSEINEKVGKVYTRDHVQNPFVTIF